MVQWLKNNGFTAKSVSLTLFDYLVKDISHKNNISFNKVIVFAGNLVKSTFIYSLSQIKGWNFRLYGPNYKNAGGCKPWHFIRIECALVR